MKVKTFLITSIVCSILLTGCGGKQDTFSKVISEAPSETQSESLQEAGEEATEKTEPESEKQSEVESEKRPEEETEEQSEVEPAEEFADEPEHAQITLLMVGDILLHTPVEESAKQSDGTYNFDAIFANTKEEIQAADLALVNQEVIIGGEELGISGYPAFNAPYEIGDALVETGFDVVCHGTNHALDKGKTGLTNCLAFWQNLYPQIGVLGIHDSAEDQDELYFYEKDGIRIAILNYTYSTNGIAMPSDMPFAVDMLEKEAVVEDIRRAEEEADFTIVCPHWGTEYNLGISSYQEKWTEIFLENGVDLVLGTHPHVIEPITWVQDMENDRAMLVYYSLGNFVNWTASSGEGIANRMVGGMAKITIEKDENGNTWIGEYGIEPLVSHLENGENGVTVYPLSEYTEELAERNQIRKQDPAFSLQYCQELCESVWGELY